MKRIAMSVQVNLFSDNFLIQSDLKQGDALTQLIFNCALEYANRKVQKSQMELKLNTETLTEILCGCTIGGDY
jgi:hypothetical protein